MRIEGQSLSLHDRVLRAALSAGAAAVFPALYKKALTATGQAAESLTIGIDEGYGPFVATGFAYDAETGGLDGDATVTVDVDGRSLTQGDVPIGEVFAAGGAGELAANPLTAAPVVVGQGGQIRAKLSLVSGNTIQADEAVTVAGFHVEQRIAQQIVNRWGIPFWAALDLISTASVQSPSQVFRARARTRLHRFGLKGSADSMSLRVNHHEVLRGDAFTEATDGPSSAASQLGSLYPLQLERGDQVAFLKRDTTARTTTATIHGVELPR